MRRTLPLCNIDLKVSAAGEMERSFDPEILDYDALVNRCMGNIDFVDRVLMRINEQMPVDLLELEQALVQEDSQQVASLAHRIKGSMANASATGLQCLAQEMEDMGRSGCLADIPPFIEAFRKEWERFHEWSTSLLMKTTSR